MARLTNTIVCGNLEVSGNTIIPFLQTNTNTNFLKIQDKSFTNNALSTTEFIVTDQMTKKILTVNKNDVGIYNTTLGYNRVSTENISEEFTIPSSGTYEISVPAFSRYFALRSSSGFTSLTVLNFYVELYNITKNSAIDLGSPVTLTLTTNGQSVSSSTGFSAATKTGLVNGDRYVIRYKITSNRTITAQSEVTYHSYRSTAPLLPIVLNLKSTNTKNKVNLYNDGLYVGRNLTKYVRISDSPLSTDDNFYVMNGMTGFKITSGGIYKTANGGTTWTLM